VAYVASVGYLTPLVSTLTTSHSVTLAALKAATTYTYYVQSNDAYGNMTVSAHYTFTTPAATTAGPVVSAITVLAVTTTGAQVTWQTNRPASTRIAYGTTVALGQFTTLDSTLSPNHWAGLSGLTSGVIYYFAVIAADASGNSTTSAVQTFATISNVGPTISSVTATPTSGNTAVINVTTNRAATAQIVYGSTTSYGIWSATTPTAATSQAVALPWVPSGTIHFQVRSIDSNGNLTVSGDYMFIEP
jgi:hypothetical protein